MGEIEASRAPPKLPEKKKKSGIDVESALAFASAGTLSAASAIQAATKKLAELKPRKTKVSHVL